MVGRTPQFTEVYARPSPFRPKRSPGLRPGAAAIHCVFVAAGRACLVVPTAEAETSALALLVARVGTDDHDPAMPADHPALVADPLDARLDLHWFLVRSCRDVTCTGRRCGHG